MMIKPLENTDPELADMIRRTLLPTWNLNKIWAIIRSGRVYHRLASCNIGAEVIADEEREMGRNSPCVCGSGKKFKKCCGSNV